MLEAFGGLVGLVTIGGSLALVFAITQWQRRRTAGAMGVVGEKRGLVAVDGLRPTLSGVIDGVKVRVETVSQALGGRQGLYTRFRLTDRNPPSGRMAPVGLREKVLRAVVGEEAVELGDPDFAARVRVEGARGEMLARLDAPARRAVEKAAGFDWYLVDGVWEVLESGRVRSADRMDAVLMAGVEAAKACRLEGSEDEALLAIANTDPVEAVREVALAERRERGLLDEPVTPVGEVELLDALRDPSQALDAAIALATAGDARDEVRMVLVGALVDEQNADRAITALGQVGSEMDVLVLGTLGEPHRAAAEAAITAIRKRTL